MTKVTVLGEDKKGQKKIEFVCYLSDRKNFEEARGAHRPDNYKNVELISRNYTSAGLDLMFAYDDDRNDGDTAALFLGYFNDGVV